MGDKRLTFTIAEAALRLGIGRNQAYKAAHDGSLPTIRFGTRLLVPRAALERLLNRPNEGPRTAQN